MADTGKVYLVGAGPGDPGLITLKGLRCLQEADLVLYDGLVNPLLLQHTSAICERTARTRVSSNADDQLTAQEELNRRLVAEAKSGKTIVRLKGGDPYIFGRGSEEARELVEAGILFEVVPGITAATASSVYAGISLTHRESASSVAFVTGHEDPTKPESSIDYQSLADFSGTLVFYMGLARLPQIAERLIQHGKPPDTPACVISRATTPHQRVVDATLAELPTAVAQAKLPAPSLIVVGECVRQRESLTWFERKPLFGQRIGITRPAHQASSAVDLAVEFGAQPVLMPTIEISPPDDWTEVDEAIGCLEDCDWLVFTSVNGVQGFLGRVWETGSDLRRLARVKLAAIGPSTAAALADFHLRADIVPPEYRAESLADALVPQVGGQCVVWAGANRGRAVLTERLEAAGATVEKVVIYQNTDVSEFSADVINAVAEGELDWIMLSSPSIAQNVARLLTEIPTTTRLASISPVTTAAAQRAGLQISAEAQQYTIPGVFDAMIRESNNVAQNAR